MILKRMLINSLIATLLFLFAQSAFAGAPEGHPLSIEPELQGKLMGTLEREGYIGSFYAAGIELQRGISAYLWDNRSRLKTVDFHNARDVDALVCLLMKKGYKGYDDYADNEEFMTWCNTLVETP